MFTLSQLVVGDPISIGLFGSHLNGNPNAGSDIDIFMLLKKQQRNDGMILKPEACRYLRHFNYNIYARDSEDIGDGKIHLCVFDDHVAFSSFMNSDSKSWIPLMAAERSTSPRANAI